MSNAIPLRGKNGHGLFAIVDDEDYSRLSQFKWRLRRGYAVRAFNHRMGENYPGSVYMQHDILKPSPGLEIDHINHDKLDNRKCNLRIATHQQNGRNKSMQKNTSGYKGVRKCGHKWVARIVIDGQQVHLGNYKTPEDAAKAYDKAAQEHFGEFAHLNFPGNNFGSMMPDYTPGWRGKHEQAS